MDYIYVDYSLLPLDGMESSFFTFISSSQITYLMTYSVFHSLFVLLFAFAYRAKRSQNPCIYV